MKRSVILYLFLTVILGSVQAQPDSLYQFIEKGNEYYKKAQYDSAIVYYNKVINAGWTAPQLYYNLGNAYFRRGILAKAILNYERAYRLDPTDENVKHNLAYAKQLIQDQFTEVRSFFLKRWWRSLALVLRADVWAIISLVLFALALVMLFLFLFSRSIQLRKTGFYSFIIALLFSLITLFLSLENKEYVVNSGEAIVLTSTSVRSSPSKQGTELYIIHPGVKVIILGSNDGWYEVKLPNGGIGWMSKSSVEKI